jgi:Protein of unknown function (DUF2721)
VQLSIETPALLFPAISFLVLAYTNRYSTLTRVARDLLREYASAPADHLVDQIAMLRGRVRIIKVMLSGAAVSMACCVVSILALYEEWDDVAKAAFMVSLVVLTATYVLAVVEIYRSSTALDVQINATMGR